MRNMFVKRLSVALAPLLLLACVVVPRTETVFDDDCKVMRRQMVLDVQQIGSFGRCANDGCATLLVQAATRRRLRAATSTLRA
jgi:hypothetical protein